MRHDPIMPNSCRRTLNISKRYDMGREEVSGLSPIVVTIYYIVIKVFNCQENKVRHEEMGLRNHV